MDTWKTLRGVLYVLYKHVAESEGAASANTKLLVVAIDALIKAGDNFINVRGAVLAVIHNACSVMLEQGVGCMHLQYDIPLLSTCATTTR